MPIPTAVLMCHAPIVIPAIARERAPSCAPTTEAMRRTAQRLLAAEPDALVVISPHAPRHPSAWGVVVDPTLGGDFARFGVPEIGATFSGAPAAGRALEAAAHAQGLATWNPAGNALDHGALVPLYFVQQTGFTGPVLLLALPYPDTGGEARMGRAIAEAAVTLGQRWAVLASGDMSHRLTHDAPAGYHPDAERFDRDYVALIAAGELKRAAAFDPELRAVAAEDVVDSVAVASAAVGFEARGHEVLSYEGPFGVGYMEAILHDDAQTNDTRGPGAEGAVDYGTTPPLALLGVARSAIEAYLRGELYRPPQAPGAAACGVFVTLRTREGELRGCVGHLEPTSDTLVKEVAACAVSAATRDVRFAPVTDAELPELQLEISVLAPPEPAELEDLDPARFGVIVSGRGRRGVLLPAIPGIEDAAEQVAIAARKAGLRAVHAEQLERFTVWKLAEADTVSSSPQGDRRCRA